MRLPAGSFYGTVLCSASASGFMLRETVYSADLKTPTHSHQNAYLGVILEGQSTQMLQDGTRTCHPGTLTFHPAGETHRDHFQGARSRLLQIEILPNRLSEMSENFTLNARSIREKNGRQEWLANRLLVELRQPDEVSPLTMEGLSLELLSEVWRSPVRRALPRPPEWLRRAKDLIHDRFAEKLALSSIAEEVGVHASHLAREFRRYYRKTVGEQVRELRIDFACQELRQTDRPLADIAAAAGFSDQSHLCRAIRKFTGYSPGSLRRGTSSPCKSDPITS